MELAKIQDVSTDSVGVLKKKDFELDEASLGLMFKSFTDSLYSNKIGSIVREITSNAIDAHVEAGVEKPVEIQMKRPDPFNPERDPGKIFFIDHGTGMSPELIDETYSKYFASTKRESNKQIGAWGIGAKTPLSYSNSFTLETISDGKLYTYMINRGERAPQISLVDIKDEPNRQGTTVMIPIASDEDYDQFVRALETQLKYFENVYFHGGVGENNYKLFRGKYFIYRQQDNRSNSDEYMDLAYGRVRYPIDFDQLGLYEDDYQVPIGMVFNIGELDVTLNREALEYTEKTKKAIRDKIVLFTQELQELANEGDDIINDFKDFVQMRTAQAAIKFDQEVLDLSNFLDPREYSFGPLLDIDPGMSMPKDLDKAFFFVDSKYRIDHQNDYKKITVNSSNYSSNRIGAAINNLINGDGPHLFVHEDKASRMKNEYLVEKYGKNIWLLKFEDIPWEKPKVLAEIMKSLKLSDEDPKAIDNLKAYIKMMKDILMEKFVQSYDDIEPPEEWVEEWMENNGSLKEMRDDRKTSLTVRELCAYQDYDSPEYRMMEYTPAQLAEHSNRLIIYGTQEDDDALLKAFDFFKHAKVGVQPNGRWKFDFKDRNTRICKVAVANQRYFELLPNAVHIRDFNETFQRSIIKQVLVNEIRNFMEYKHLYNKEITKHIKHYDEYILILENFSKENCRQRTHLEKTLDQDYFYDPFYMDHTKYQDLDYTYVHTDYSHGHPIKVPVSIRKILSYLYGVAESVQLLTHMDTSRKPSPYRIREYLKFKNQRLSFPHEEPNNRK